MTTEMAVVLAIVLTLLCTLAPILFSRRFLDENRGEGL